MHTSRDCVRNMLGILLVLIVVAGCGRREGPAPFDARIKPGSTAPKANALPASAIRVTWVSSNMPTAVSAGSTTPVTVTFTNAGDQAWPDNASANPSLKDGSYAVRLGYMWSRPSDAGSEPDRHPARANLPASLQPGETVSLAINVVAPQEPGDYLVDFDLVQELVFWFSGRGGDTLTVPVRVGPLDGEEARDTP